MRADISLPLGSVQPTAPSRSLLGGGETSDSVEKSNKFPAALRNASAEPATVVAISGTEATPAGNDRAYGPEIRGSATGRPDDPFAPEIFGDEPDELIGDASKLGLAETADDLSAEDSELYGAADEFGEDGVFQVYGAPSVDDSHESPAEEAQRHAHEEATPGGELTPDEARMVAELRARDNEVRSHEAAHIAAGGGLTGGMSLSFQVGPDGKRYAIGGEVSIDASPGSSPEETILKAQRIRAAALAPAEPSAQDRSVAARAGQMESEARSQLRTNRAQQLRETLSGLQPGESEDGFPPKTVTLGEVEGLSLPGGADIEADETDPAIEAALEPRGEDVDLMEVFRKMTGASAEGEDAESRDAEDTTAVRLGGRLSTFGNGTAAEAQLNSSGASLMTAIQAVTSPTGQAYALVA